MQHNVSANNAILLEHINLIRANKSIELTMTKLRASLFAVLCAVQLLVMVELKTAIS